MARLFAPIEGWLTVYRVSEQLIFAFGTMMTMIFAFGAMLMIREFRRAEEKTKRRAARRAVYTKPRVVDIDPKDER